MAVSTTQNSLNPNPSNYFDRVLWDREKRFDVYNLFGQVRRLPMKNSSNLTVRRFDALDDTPVAATEGVTPALETVTKADVDIELQQFIKVVALSDRVIIEDQSDDANEVADMLSQNMFEMLDKVTRDTLTSTATQIDAVNGVNGNAVTEITQTDLDVVIDFLEGSNGKRFTPDMMGSAIRFGSNPVEAAYWGICHTDMRKDIRALSSFFPTSQYPQADALQAELGATDEVRWVRTSAGSITSGSPDIYNNFVCAQNAYGIASIDEVATEMIIKPLGWGEDYANQRQTMAWKAMFGAAIVVDDWIVNFRTSLSS
jgi:N4-gp56 family major capsid protein